MVTEGSPMLGWSVQVEGQVWEQSDKISLECSELKLPMRQPVVMPRMQLDYIVRAREEGLRMGRKMGIIGLWSWR